MIFCVKRRTNVDNLKFEELIKNLNQRMLVDKGNRIPILKKVLNALGNPDQKFKIIHLAGTNGKGSTGGMLRQALSFAGFKVGHFSSPALFNIREQIKIGNQMIAKADFVRTYNYIKARLPLEINDQDISIFEWFVLIMLQYFADEHIEWAVIEAGLGGKNDATNIISTPLITIFTHIDLDHIRILGDTVEEIAENKAGIIKNKTNIFLADRQYSSVKSVIRQKSALKQVNTFNEVRSELIKPISRSINGTVINVQTNLIRLTEIKFNLIGEFQLDNLATVITVYNWLLTEKILSEITPLAKMIKTIRIPGRMQVINRNPIVIVDGAHNVDGTKQLIQSIKLLKPQSNYYFILGFLRDKDYEKMAEMYTEVATKIITVRPDNAERALNDQELKELFGKEWFGSAPNAKDAIKNMKKIVGPGDLIVLSGSFYLIKEMERLNDNTI